MLEPLQTPTQPEDRPPAQQRTPPGPPRSWLPGWQLWRLRRDPLAFLTGLARQYGDIACVRFGSRQLTLLNHPDFIKTVLVDRSQDFAKGEALQHARLLLGNGLLTSEGELHLRQRRMIQPVFHRQRVAVYAAAMADLAGQAAAGWQDGQALDLHQAMMRLTMAIAARCLFDVDVTAEADEIGAAISTLLAEFDRLLLPFGESLLRLPLPAMQRSRAALERLDSLIQAMVAQRRSDLERGLPPGDDLLTLLLLAQDEAGAGMSDRQVRDEALTLFLAGHETTANALTWTWVLLSQHPAVETRLQTELQAVLGGRPPAAADIERLVYTRMLLQEALRLYPPAWVIGRQALSDVDLGGYRIPRGSAVLMSQWVMQRDPRYYPDPERFDPERWSPDSAARLPRFAYFPFGGGPRLCIGESFAWMEATLVLASLAQSWQVRLAPGYRPALQPVITLRPKDGPPVRLVRRPGNLRAISKT